MLIGSSTSFVGESQIGSDDSNSQTVSPGVGGLTLAGFAALIFVNVIVAPGVGSLSAQGFAPTVTASDHQTVQPGFGSLTLEGFAPAVTASDNQTVAAGFGELVLDGFAPVVSATDNQTVTPDVGALILSGFEPSIAVDDNQNVATGLGALSLSGFAPTVSASDNQTVLPGLGQLVITGFSPVVPASASQIVTPGTGALVLTGFAPTVVSGINLALFVDSTGGPRYRVRSSGSPSYQIDSTGGARYRVVRGHEITSALEVSDPNVIPYNSLTLHPHIIEGDDFSGYADIAAADAAWVPRFNQFVFTTGCTIDNTVLCDGRQTLRVPEGDGDLSDTFLELTKSNITPVTDVWWRVMFRLPSTFNGKDLLLGFVAANASSWQLSAQYRVDYAGSIESWRNEGGVDIPMSLASLKSRWVSVLSHHEIVAGHPKATLYVDGAELTTYTGAGTDANYTKVDADLDCLPQSGPGDPTNNYMNIGLFEWVDGTIYPNPFGV